MPRRQHVVERRAAAEEVAGFSMENASLMGATLAAGGTIGAIIIAD